MPPLSQTFFTASRPFAVVLDSIFSRSRHAASAMTSNLQKSRPIIISGPSGTGKSTLIKKLFDAHPNTFRFSISHTTRQPRAGEQDGREYHFVTGDEFAKLKQEGEMLETAEFGSNSYGTSRKAVQEDEAAPAKHRCCVLDIEMEASPFLDLPCSGVKQLRNTPDFSARYLFIAPPSTETLERRLRSRATDAEDKIKWRLEQAKKELKYAEQEGVHDYRVVNDDLDTAYRKVEDWVMEGLREDGVL